MEEIRVRAIRFVQNGRVFYMTVMGAGDLIRRSEVDVWNADAGSDDAGYQRAPSRARLREVATYVESESAILPLGGLLNARPGKAGSYGGVLLFDPDHLTPHPVEEDESPTSGWLTIPDKALPLFIVDMQHRLGGLGFAINENGREDLYNFPVPVTIADGLPKLEEVEQFELINTTQKKVRTDLARRLMSIQAQDADKRLNFDKKGKLWEARGPIVADWLNRNGKIWKDRVQPPNKSKTEVPRAIVRETSFVTSMKPILQSPLFQRLHDDQVADVIDKYWQALARVFPDAFQNPANQVIQKTPGIFALNALAPEVIELVRSENKPLTVENMTEVMEPWRDLGPGFWESGNVEDGASKYGSMKGFSMLAAEMRKMLPSLDLAL